MALRFRDAIRAAVPRWLRNGLAEKIGYAIGVTLDALGDWTAYGVRARFPGQYSPESLAAIGNDRKLPRGVLETDDEYADRLRRWLDIHCTRGNPYTFLEQLQAYWGPSMTADLEYDSGRTYSIDGAGVITRGDAGGAKPLPFPHWYLYPVGTALDASGGVIKWGSAGNKWGELGLWGTSFSKADVDRLRLVPSLFNSAHGVGHIVMASGAEVTI